MLDTREYDIEYNDGTIETQTENLIAENILSQVDEKGHRQMILEEIIDHKYVGKVKCEQSEKIRKRHRTND